MADQNSQLEKILTHLDTLHTKIDSMGDEHKQLGARLDAIEQEREQEKADAKAKTDAEEKERADAEARIAANPELARKLAAIERGAVTLSHDSRNAFAEAQMRADAAYQAWGKQAPNALHGETLRDFKIRLLRPLQQHSKRYAQSALNLIGDDAAFEIVNDAIINDAVDASSDPATIGSALREVTTRSDSGHVVRKFVGDPAVTWAPFQGGATRFGRINARPGK